jgi:hypothetical protein
VPRGTQVPVKRDILFAYGTFTLSGRPFQCLLTKDLFCNSLGEMWLTLTGLSTPVTQRPHAYTLPV